MPPIVIDSTTPTAPRVEPGSFLTLHYRLAGPRGDIINTFDGKPATLSLGSGELSPAVESCLLGMQEGTRRPSNCRRAPLLANASRRCSNGWHEPCWTSSVTMQRPTMWAMWCSFRRPTDKAVMPARWCRWATATAARQFCSISTIHWPGSLWYLKFC